MKILMALAVVAATLSVAAPARAQDDKQELKNRLLEEIRKKLDAEMERILKDIEKLIDDEIAKARGRKPATPPPAAPPAAPGRAPFLGVRPDQEQPEPEDFEAWKVEGGVRITLVEGAPAEKAGLRDGDVIIEAGGAKVREWAELPESLRGKKPGDKVKIKFLRGKETKELEVTLGARPDDPPADPDSEPPAPAPPAPKAPETRPGRLGVMAGDPTGKGMAVSSVSPGTPAEKAGIKEGDVLTKLDETAIWKESDLEAFMKKTKPGQKVEVTILRGTEEKKFSVVLAETRP